jgi:transcriptional regulator with XRE-family HTH domain
MIDYSNKFKHLRSHFGLTQQQLADKAGISRSVLSQIEIGNQKPTLDTIGNIARIYNIPYSYFFEENEVLPGKKQNISGKLHIINDSDTLYDKNKANIHEINSIEMLKGMIEKIVIELDDLKSEVMTIKSGNKKYK